MTTCSRRKFAASHIAVALLAATVHGSAPALAQAPGKAARFVVVVNASNPMEEIHRESLSNLFLKRAAVWPSGKLAQPVDLTQQDPAREAFSRQILRKPLSAVRAYWQQQIFSGRDVPPPEEASDADVIAMIKAAPGAVGYVSASTPLPSGVKVLAVRGVQ